MEAVNSHSCPHMCGVTYCTRRRVNKVYSYCMEHMFNQKPIKDIEKPDNCPICFDGESDEKFLHLTCGHWFHETCIILSGRVGCPICRQFIFLKKSVFLKVRIVNLKRKLELVENVYDRRTVKRLKSTLKTVEMFLDKSVIDLECIDKFLQIMNKEIYSMIT